MSVPRSSSSSHLSPPLGPCWERGRKEERESEEEEAAPEVDGERWCQDGNRGGGGSKQPPTPADGGLDQASKRRPLHGSEEGWQERAVRDSFLLFHRVSRPSTICLSDAPKGVSIKCSVTPSSHASSYGGGCRKRTSFVFLLSLLPLFQRPLAPLYTTRGTRRRTSSLQKRGGRRATCPPFLSHASLLSRRRRQRKKYPVKRKGSSSSSSSFS